jgi:hypothetical protein
MTSHQRKMAIIISVVVICLAVAGVLIRNKFFTSQQATHTYKEVAVDSFVVPPYFPDPSTLPIPEGSELVKNYVATPVGEGKPQAGQAYRTKVSTVGLFGLFRNYFLTTSGWSLTQEIGNTPGPSAKALFAKNPRGEMRVTIYEDSHDPAYSIVDLIFIVAS